MTRFARTNYAGGEEYSPGTGEEMRLLPITNPDQLFVICLLARPGLHEALVDIEESFYRPDTPANGKFELVLVRWPEDAPLLWAIIAVPYSDKEKVRQKFEGRGFSLQAALPSILGERVETFPIEFSTNVFTIEGVGYSRPGGKE